MTKRRRGLELYEVLKREREAAQVRIRDFVRPSPLEASRGSSEEPLAPGEAETAQGHPAAEDAIAAPGPEPMPEPQAVVRFEAAAREEPAVKPALAEAVIERCEEPVGREPYTVTLTSGKLALAVVGVLAAVIVAFVVGRGTAPTALGPEVTTEENDPLAEARRTPITFGEVSITPDKQTRAEIAPQADEPKADGSEAIKGDYWELLIATYPVAARAMANRALDAFKRDGFEGVRLAADGRHLALWGPRFPADKKAEAVAFMERVKEAGPRLNKAYNLGQLKDFRDCEHYFRKAKK